VIFIEVLGRHGEVVRRERIPALPVRIGRGYDNDLILDDPHVCPRHAVLEETGTGELALRDQESVNGLLTLPAGEHLDVVRMTPDTVVQLGRTPLRVRDTAQTVPESIPMARRSRIVEWALNHWTAAFAWIALLVAIGAFQTVREATREIEWTTIATRQGRGLLPVLVWAGAWGLVTRLMTHRAHFVTHLAIAVLALLASSLEERLFGLAQFLFAPIAPLQIADQIASALILAAAIFSHLTVLGAGGIRNRAFAAAAVGGAMLAPGLIEHFTEEPAWRATLPYWSQLEPMSTKWLPVMSTDTYFDEVENLEAELQSLRAELDEEAEETRD
jgi:hypothetical protein